MAQRERERERERDLCFRGKPSTHRLAPRLLSYPPSGDGDDTTVLLEPKCMPRQGSQCYARKDDDVWQRICAFDRFVAGENIGLYLGFLKTAKRHRRRV